MTHRVLVIGGYGLIGSAIVTHLAGAGYQMTALGRSERSAHRFQRGVGWIIRDLADLTSAADWQPLLSEIDFVVNCAGALQTTPQDDLDLVHIRAVEAIAQACALADIGLVHISAAGVSPSASTAFFRSKAAGEAAIVATGVRHWILRPGLVIAPGAYGGTALIRMLAAIPYVQPLTLADAQIQSVSVEDVTRAVAWIIEGKVPEGIVYDLVEEEPYSLSQLLALHRRWLGYPAARIVVALPGWTARMISGVADGLGHLGWRSPLRSSAMLVLRDGVRGDPSRWRQVYGPVKALPETLMGFEAGPAQRLSARMQLLLPAMIVTLSLFWLISGLMGFVQLDQAAQVLIDIGWSKGLAVSSVLFWSCIDIALGVLILFRRWAGWACLGMIVVSLFYLGAATLVTPALWLDPLGPLVKVIPGLFVPLITREILETR